MINYFDTAPCSYFAFDDNGTILMVNQTLCDVLGFTKEELIASHVESIFPISTRIFYQTHFFPILKLHGSAEEIFVFLKAKNSEQIPVLMNAKREEFAGEIQSSCACIVVKNRKKFEDELVLAKKQAETALAANTDLQKAKEQLFTQTTKLDQQIQIVSRQNSELKQFGRVATHNLQEPLRKILLFAKLLQENPVQDTSLKKKLERLLRIADTMRETINGLQQFVWLSEMKVNASRIPLSLIIAAVQQELQTEFKADLLEIYEEDLPTITADREQIKLLFYHLIRNAIQYRKPGEKAIVKISAAIIKKNQFKSIENKYHYQDTLQITVQDQGIGFEGQYKNIIFELFRKLHHQDRRGVGLSLCKQIVENHGGWIEADSIIAVHTNILIFLPAELTNQ